MRISTKDPADMSADERICEIANILTRALERSSTGLPSASKHSCDEQKSS